MFDLLYRSPGMITPHTLWSAWTFDLSILIPLALSLSIYLWGIRNAWKRAGPGHGISLHRFASFIGALLALIIALLSPLDQLSEALFSAHMAQHLVFILIAAPLLVLSDFQLAFVWALPRPWARRLAQAIHRSTSLAQVWRDLSNPISAWVLSTFALWIWHAPTLYQAALENNAIHALEHLSFLLTAMLFWWVLFKHSHQKHIHYGMAILYLFFTAIQSSILSALLTFSVQPWYPYYADLVKPWGLTPLQDQQLAGLIMWLPGGAVYTLLTIGYFEAWFRAMERRSTSKLPLR